MTLREEVVVATARAIDRLFARGKSHVVVEEGSKPDKTKTSKLKMRSFDFVGILCATIERKSTHVRAVVDVQLIGSSTEAHQAGLHCEADGRKSARSATFFLVSEVNRFERWTRSKVGTLRSNYSFFSVYLVSIYVIKKNSFMSTSKHETLCVRARN